jgi:hypothetical protein
LNKILELSAINKKGDSFPIELTVVLQQGKKNFSFRDITQRKIQPKKNTLGK